MRHIKVQEVFDPKDMLSVVVPEDDSLEDVIRRFAEAPSLRGIFLVDSRQRFAGVITRADLLKWAQYRLGGGPGSDRLSVGEIFRLVYATRAKDLAHGDWRTLGVRPTDTLDRALHQMITNEEIDIPVLDQEGKILGDLRLSQILLKALETGKQAG